MQSAFARRTPTVLLPQPGIPIRIILLFNRFSSLDFIRRCGHRQSDSSVTLYAKYIMS